MIRPIFSTNPYNFLKTAPKKASKAHSQVSFSGIMDNPSSKRITDANGNTYIVEPGGQLTIKNETKEKNGAKGALTGAGAGAAGGTVAAKGNNSKNSASQKTDDTEELKNHEIKEDEASQNEINAKNDDEIEQNSEISDDLTDISETEYDDSDDEVIFDDEHPIYVF